MCGQLLIEFSQIRAATLLGQEFDQSLQAFGVCGVGQDFLVLFEPVGHFTRLNGFSLFARVFQRLECGVVVGQDTSDPFTRTEVLEIGGGFQFRNHGLDAVLLDGLQDQLPGRIVPLKSVTTGAVAGKQAWTLRERIVDQQLSSTVLRNSFPFRQHDNSMGIAFGKLQLRLMRLIVAVFMQRHHGQDCDSRQNRQQEASVEVMSPLLFANKWHQEDDSHQQCRDVNRTKGDTELGNLLEFQEAEQEQEVPFGPRWKIFTRIRRSRQFSGFRQSEVQDDSQNHQTTNGIEQHLLWPEAVSRFSFGMFRNRNSMAAEDVDVQCQEYDHQCWQQPCMESKESGQGVVPVRGPPLSDLLDLRADNR